ncbi:hypothetical protein C8Q80DRAFT_890132 [Daedaleopsis nitida]|nr:hypothetical protein C8Q80DRAFT_890132 [Daedaleopsis nitida]
MQDSFATNYSVPGLFLMELLNVTTVADNKLWLDKTILFPELHGQFLEAVLSTMFCGLYTCLALFAVYLLCQKGLTMVAKSAMLLAIAVIYASTTVYWAVLLTETFKTLSTVTSNSNAAGEATGQAISALHWLLDPERTPEFAPSSRSGTELWLYRLPQKCVGTASLTVNVVLGDAMVWWRAWVLWRSSRTVRAICVLLISATFATGVIVTTHACSNLNTLDTSVLFYADGGVSTRGTGTVGSFFTADSWGLATSALSLGTNIVATSLIAYKAWHHRRSVACHLRMGSARTQVEKALTLFVESGMLYCILWVFIVVYQSLAGSDSEDPGYGVRGTEERFTYGFDYVLEGCLIPLIGIYPTLIIILVALDRSYCGTSFRYASANNASLLVPPGLGTAHAGPFHLGLSDSELKMPRDRPRSLNSSSNELPSVVQVARA